MLYTIADFDFTEFCDLLDKLASNMHFQTEELAYRLQKVETEESALARSQRNGQLKPSSRTLAPSKTDNFIPIFVAIAAGD